MVKNSFEIISFVYFTILFWVLVSIVLFTIGLSSKILNRNGRQRRMKNVQWIPFEVNQKMCNIILIYYIEFHSFNNVNPHDELSILSSTRCCSHIRNQPAKKKMHSIKNKNNIKNKEINDILCCLCVRKASCMQTNRQWSKQRMPKCKVIWKARVNEYLHW